MKRIKIETEIVVFETEAELPVQVKQLVTQAKQARLKAYAPYSNFKVGAAILLDNGEIITGNNQENASYPSGLCAERTAIYYAKATYPDAKIKCIALAGGVTGKINRNPVPPCGACRQAMVEYEIKQSQPIEIYFTGTEGEVLKSCSVANVLPLIFDKSQL